VFLNRRAAAQYRALASIISGHERPEETTMCYKTSLVQLITNLMKHKYFTFLPSYLMNSTGGVGELV